MRKESIFFIYLWNGSGGGYDIGGGNVAGTGGDGGNDDNYDDRNDGRKCVT